MFENEHEGTKALYFRVYGTSSCSSGWTDSFRHLSDGRKTSAISLLSSRSGSEVFPGLLGRVEPSRLPAGQRAQGPLAALRAAAAELADKPVVDPGLGEQLLPQGQQVLLLLALLLPQALLRSLSVSGFGLRCGFRLRCGLGLRSGFGLRNCRQSLGLCFFEDSWF